MHRLHSSCLEWAWGLMKQCTEPPPKACKGCRRDSDIYHEQSGCQLNIGYDRLSLCYQSGNYLDRILVAQQRFPWQHTTLVHYELSRKYCNLPSVRSFTMAVTWLYGLSVDKKNFLLTAAPRYVSECPTAHNAMNWLV